MKDRNPYAREWARKKRAANREEYNAYMREWRARNRLEARYIAQKGHAKWVVANPERAIFVQQRAAAKRREIEFLLTFEEWWNIWKSSGKWKQRGKRKGQYVMARYGDRGPYAADNVRICTVRENCHERLGLL